MRCYDSLRRQAEIASVRRRGRRTATGTFAAYASDLASQRPRVAVTVAKTVGKAVVRNLIRRRVRGALDALSAQLPAKTGLLFIARPQAAQATYPEIAADIARMVADLGYPAQRAR
jgi:ribonuclease P protein component